MADDAQAVVNEPVVTDTTPTESAPVETATSEVGEYQTQQDNGELKLPPPAPEEPEDVEQSTEDETKEVAEEEQPQTEADKRKQQLNTEIRDLVSQRNTIKQEVEKLNAEVYQPATEDDLLEQINPETGEYYNRLEAKVAAMEQTASLEKYNTQVAETQLTLQHEATKALQEFPMFDDTSSDYNKELTEQVDALLGQNLVFDQNTGQIIGSHTSPYQLYQTVAMAARTSEQAGQLKGQKATEQMLASVDTTSSSQKGDKPFEKLSLNEMEDRLRKAGHDI